LPLRSSSPSARALPRRLSAPPLHFFLSLPNPTTGGQDYLEAEAEVKKGLAAEPENGDLLKLAARLKAALKASAKKEAALYGKMFK